MKKIMLIGLQEEGSFVTHKEDSEDYVLAENEFYEFTLDRADIEAKTEFFIEESAFGEEVEKNYLKEQGMHEMFVPDISYTWFTLDESDSIKFYGYIPTGYGVTLTSEETTKVDYKKVDSLPTVTQKDLDSCNLNYGFSTFEGDTLTYNEDVSENCSMMTFITYGGGQTIEGNGLGDSINVRDYSMDDEELISIEKSAYSVDTLEKTLVVRY